MALFAVRATFFSRASTLCWSKVGRVVSDSNRMQVASITSKALRKDRQRPKPFPYQEKPYSLWYQLFDDTLARFDDNTKIIVVEGNIGSGKSSLAKTIADELEMLHVPEASLDLMFVEYGDFDIRSIDHLVPPSCRSFDIKDFYANPKSDRVAEMQFNMLQVRLEQYIDAMAHMMNTGQGVVLERSPFSDSVFMEVMGKFGYVSKRALEDYRYMSMCVDETIKRPHLVIYLDTPVDNLMKRIKQRNIPHEVNSKVLNAEYLKAIDEQYKMQYLKKVQNESYLMIYDWSEPASAEDVVEDIEAIDFEKILADNYDTRLASWRFLDWDQIWDLRYRSTMKRREMVNRCVAMYPSMERLMLLHPQDWVHYVDVYNEHCCQYAKGYENKTPWQVLFKTDTVHYRDIVGTIVRTGVGAA